MAELQYGDVCFHEVTEKTRSKIRSFIWTAQSLLFRGSSTYQTTVHVSIYIGRSKGDVPENFTAHRVVEMDEPGLSINHILNHEKMHIVRCKNKKLATLVGDLALSWALRSNNKYTYSDVIKTVFPRYGNEFPHIILTQLKKSLFTALPAEMSFTCVGFVNSLYNVATSLMAIDTKKYIDVSHRSSPSEFRKFFDNHPEFEHEDIQLIHYESEEPILSKEKPI